MTTCNFLASMAYCIYGWPKRCDCLAILSAKLDSDLFSMFKVGSIVYSLWYPLACRILRRYVSEQKPSTALVTLTKLCVQVLLSTLGSDLILTSTHQSTKKLFDVYKTIQSFSNLNVKTHSFKSY